MFTAAGKLFLASRATPSFTPPEINAVTTLNAAAWGGSLSMPSHAAGDLLLMFFSGFGGSSITAPAAGGTVPVWTKLSTANDNLVSCWYAIASVSNHTTGTWNTSNEIIQQAISISGVGPTPIGNYASSVTYSTAAPTSPSLSLVKTDATSLLLCFIGSYRQNTTVAAAINSVPSGYTIYSNNNYGALPNADSFASALITKDDSSTDGTFSITLSSQTNSARIFYLEIRSN